MVLRLLVLVCLAAAGLSAHEVISTKLTWTEHVSRIFHKRCYRCHRPGGSAPMPLGSYREVRPWAKAIKVQALSRRMPPWGPVKGYGHFRNDLSLSQEEIAVISSWVEGGAPEGNPIFEKGLPPEEDLVDPPPPKAKPLALAPGMKLESDVIALGIEPLEAEEEASIEVRAQAPDGQVRHLLWIRIYRKRWRRAFYYREPLPLPAGTKILVFPKEGASVRLLVK